MRRAALVAVAAAFVAAAPAGAGVGQASFAMNPERYDPNLSVTRSYFVAQAKPGTTFTNGVRIVNRGGTSGTAMLYAVDATTGQTSGAVYLDRGKPRHDVGSWVTLGAQSVTLGPGQSRVVRFTVHVPAGAHPGDHLGGIVAENAALTQASGSGALRIRVKHLTIVAVLAQIPGPAAALVRPTRVYAGGEHGYQYVYIHLANGGAVATKPTGRLLISTPDGKEVAARDLALDTFLPGTAIDYPVLLPKTALAPGRYHATVDLTWSAAPIGYRQTTGASQSSSTGFEFTVTEAQHQAVFKGVAPLPGEKKQPSAKQGGTSITLLLTVGIGAAVLAAALVLVFFGFRRWSAR